MAARGEVLAARRAVGFLPNARLERFLVLQADGVTRVSETVLVAPLDDALEMYAGLPGALPVSAREAGSGKPQVALLATISTVPLGRFELAPVGRLGKGTLGRMDQLLKLVLDLP